MRYLRETFTIPETVVARLAKERNKSARVTEALRDYYEDRDNLGSLDYRLSELEDQVKAIRQLVNEIHQYVSMGRR